MASQYHAGFIKVVDATGTDKDVQTFNARDDAFEFCYKTISDAMGLDKILISDAEKTISSLILARKNNSPVFTSLVGLYLFFVIEE